MSLFITKQDTAINGTNNFYYIYSSANIGANLAFFSQTNNQLSTPRVQALPSFSSNSNATTLNLPIVGAVPGAGSTGEYVANDRTVWAELQKSRGAVTFDGTANTMNLNSHGIANGTLLGFSGGTMPTGLSSNTQYYVVNTATNTLQLSLTLGGSAIDFTGNGSGTITLWQTIGSKSLASTAINADITTYGENIFVGYVPFDFTEGAVAVTTTDTYQVRMVQTGGTVGNWAWMQATAGNFGVAVVSDTVGTPTSNTDIVFIRHRLSIASNYTAKGASSGSTYPALIMMSPNTAPSSSATATIGLFSENADSGQPSGAYTLTMDGAIMYGSYYCFAFGSSTHPITNAKKFTLTNAGFTTNSTWLTPMAPIASRGIWQSKGEICTNPFAILTADDVAGQKVFAVDRDVSTGTLPWQVGDTLKRYKDSTKAYNGIGNPSYSLASTTATTITTSANHGTGTALVGGRVYNDSSRYGVYFNCTTSMNLYEPVVLDMSGCYITSLGLNVPQDVIKSSYNSKQQQYILQDCYLKNPILVYCFTPQNGFLMNRCYGSSSALMAGTISNTSLQAYYSVSAPIYNSGVAQITNCESWNNVSGAGIILANNLRNPVVDSNTLGNLGTAGGLTYTLIQGISPLFRNNNFWGIAGSTTTSGSVYLGTCINGYASGNTFNNCTISYLAGQFPVINFQSVGDTFGTTTVNTADFAFYGTSFIDLLFTSPVGNMIVDTTYAASLISSGSSVRIRNYNTTIGDYRSWWKEGKYVSSSGKLLAETYQTTSSLVNTYNATSDTIATNKCGIIVNCKIGNSAYYAGTRTAPKLTVTYDLTSTQVATKTENTTREVLEADFTPTTSNNPVTVALSQKTDATGTNADVTWDTLTFAERSYGYTESRYTKAITETIKDVIYNYPTLVADPQITVTNGATVAGYSEFTINHATQTVTVTASTTIQRLYDYAQYNLTLNLGYANWLTKSGTDLTSSYNIVLNTGVALTGGGSINVGALTFTKNGTATYDGIIITSTNRTVHITASGLQAGSTVSDYNTSDSASISNAVVAGTTLDDLFTWTTNKNLALDVKKYGYYPFSTTSTVTSLGVAISVIQTADTHITQANVATVAAYSGITINHATSTCTISAGHSIKELYDYAQYDLTLTANSRKTQWLTTSNDVDYTSTYNITIDGVALTGTGSLDVGAKTASIINGGSTTLVFKSTAKTYNLISLTGLVAGSTVQIYDVTAVSELYNAVVAGTSVTLPYTWTGANTLRVRVRKAGYIPFEYSAPIAQTGFSLIVGQEVDSVYIINNVDGSTVTEFAFSGSTVMVYVDDPDNMTTGQRMYNWYQYFLATTTYIGLQANLITGQTSWSYVLDDTIKLHNQDLVNTLFITGANINNASNTGDVIDTSGGKININGYFPFSAGLNMSSQPVIGYILDDEED